MYNTFVICGDDKRYRHLAALLVDDEKEVYLWGCSFSCLGCRPICTLYTLTKPVVLVLPFTVQDAEQIYALKTVPRSSVIVGGPLTPGADEVLQEKELTYHNLLDDLSYKRDNAIPTAEGVLALVIGETDRVLRGQEILLFGYGSVGKDTAKLFSACGAKVCVASVSEEELTSAKESGFDTLKLPLVLNGDKGFLKKFFCCINTIPCSKIVNNEFMRGFAPTILLVEIASGGDNLDYAAAEDCGIRVLRAMSLPGKIAPRSAAEYIRNTLYQYLK